MTSMSFFWYNLFSLSCVAAAVTMALYDKPGWGWFLFVAACMAAVPSSGKNASTPANHEEKK